MCGLFTLGPSWLRGSENQVSGIGYHTAHKKRAWRAYQTRWEQQQ